MTELLFFLLLFLAVCAFFLLGECIVQPGVLAVLIFAASTLVAIFYLPVWGMTVHFVTVAVIIGSMMFFLAGGYFGQLAGKKLPVRLKEDLEQPEEPVLIQPWFLLFLLLVVAVLSVIYFFDTYRLAVAYGYGKNPDFSFTYCVRMAINSPTQEYGARSRFCHYSELFTEAVALFFTFTLLRNVIVCKRKDHLVLYLLLALSYVPIQFLSSLRTSYIHFIYFAVVISAVFLFRKENWSTKVNRRIALVGLISVVAFFVVFIVLGLLRGNLVNGGVFGTIALYLGQPIPAFDYYLTHLSEYPANTLFGEHTLFSFYRLLQRVNPSIPVLYAPYEFFPNGGNLYTALRRYHQDYGWFGLFFMMTFLGAGYSFLFERIKRNKSSLLLMVYALISYPVIEMSMEERFFMEIASPSTMIKLLLLGLFWFLFYVKGFLLKSVDKRVIRC